MIQKVTVHNWRKVFARSAAYRAEEIRFFREVERRHKEDRAADRAEDDIGDLTATAVLASDTEVAAFRTELDDYRAATIESLIESERQLAEVRVRLDAMLAQAYVLPDGRRVFKTQDGQRVFDEHGAEVGMDIIDPEMIEDWRPHAEGYLADREFERDVMEDRDRKVELLDHIDAMDERAGEVGLTTDDLEDMRNELADFAPEDVKQRVMGNDYRAPIDLGQQFGVVAAKTNVTMPRLAADELGFDH